jgi:hypothetical protein
VVRDGAQSDIATGDLVADDLVDLWAGDQLVADGMVRASASLQADGSLLTGESEPVDKRAGDPLLSGSFVIAGAGDYQATGVGAEAYARKLAAQARRFTVVRSELVAGINQILRYVTWAIPPVAVLLVVSQLHTREDVREGATSTVAALVGMVPQGLVLLTSVAFGVAAVSRYPARSWPARPACSSSLIVTRTGDPRLSGGARAPSRRAWRTRTGWCGGCASSRPVPGPGSRSGPGSSPARPAGGPAPSRSPARPGPIASWPPSPMRGARRLPPGDRARAAASHRPLSWP